MNERYLRKAVLGTAFLLIFWGLSSAAVAQVAISPVRVDLSDDHTKDVIKISSQASKTVSYQVEIVSWSQTEEKREVYTPTEDILAVPPLFTLQPGEEQIVRVGMLTDAHPSTEQSYRMFITELAGPQEEAAESTGVNMRLRLGVPVFIAPRALPNATLEHIDSRQMENQLFMQMRNSGNTHVRISEVKFHAPGASEPKVEAAAIYVLAGQVAFVPVVLPDNRREGKVTLVTDTLGTVEYELPAAN
jgi:fimbrial chaperone protein